MRLSPKLLAILTSVFLADCGGDPGGPSIVPCDASGSQSITLVLGQYQSIPPVANAGCLEFPGNASLTDSAVYLLVPQLATDSPGATAAFVLHGESLTVAAALQASAAAGPSRDPAVRFHDFLRRQERTHWADLPAAPATAGPLARSATETPPPTVGSTRVFSVCRNLTCSSFQSVTATAKTVTGHLAIYVDNTAPTGGLSQSDLDNLGTLFDSRLYALDTTAFGRESDIDNNTVVAVLMTGVVNKLVTKSQCEQSGGAFVAGFFFGADIDPAFANDPRFNHGEVFYSIVADSAGTLSCAHTASSLKRLVPVTFVHEFQHMISYNQHVLLRSGDPQATWLDEGLSHFAEELGGRSYLPGDPATFSDYVIGDLLNAYGYLDSSGTHFLAFDAGIGSLSERGAAWLFVRYLVDQFASDTSFSAIATFMRSLEQTNLVGGATVTAATGQPFATVVSRWALANYVSDLPGFNAPPELQYVSWRFRTIYASLHAQRPDRFGKPFPLTTPSMLATAVSLVGTLRAGSGWYALATQAPSAPGFRLLFSGPGGAALPAALIPRLNVIRIQ